MPLSDAITRFLIRSKDIVGSEAAYRALLYRQLVDAGISSDMYKE